MANLELKHADPYRSDEPMDRNPMLAHVAGKAVDIAEAWAANPGDANLSRHLSEGPLQLSEIGVRKFEDFLAEPTARTEEEFRQGTLKLMVDDMLVSSERRDIGADWEYAMQQEAMQNGTFTFDKEIVQDLMRDENPIEVETRAGEGWTDRQWAEKFVGQGFDVSGVSLEHRIHTEAQRLMADEVSHRAEVTKSIADFGRFEEALSTAQMIMGNARGRNLLHDDPKRHDQFETEKLIPLLISLHDLKELGGGQSPVAGERGAPRLTEEDLDYARRAVYPDLRRAYQNDEHLVETVAYALADKGNLKMVNEDDTRKMIYPDLRPGYDNDQQLVDRAREAINAARASELVMAKLRAEDLVLAKPDKQRAFQENRVRLMLDPGAKTAGEQAEAERKTAANLRAREDAIRTLSVLTKGPADRAMPAMPSKSNER